MFLIFLSLLSIETCFGMGYISIKFINIIIINIIIIIIIIIIITGMMTYMKAISCCLIREIG